MWLPAIPSTWQLLSPRLAAAAVDFLFELAERVGVIQKILTNPGGSRAGFLRILLLNFW